MTFSALFQPLPGTNPGVSGGWDVAIGVNAME
jgi:hypothetical protein